MKEASVNWQAIPSTYGNLFTMNGRVITWHTERPSHYQQLRQNSCQQSCVYKKECSWNNFWQNYLMKQCSITIFCDNKVAIELAKKSEANTLTSNKNLYTRRFSAIRLALNIFREKCQPIFYQKGIQKVNLYSFQTLKWTTTLLWKMPLSRIEK